ncbi:MAG: RNA recognition motif domain-containing protein [Candidatus Dormibacteria bacterium]
MATKLFVGGLPYSVTSDQLREFFEAVGNVASAQVIVDKYSNQSKGFGFVEMATESEAQNAVSQLNGTEMSGRTITVNEARPQEHRPHVGGGGGGGGRSNYGGGGGGGRRY